MTNVLYEPGDYRLRLVGHAGATENGFDPVCAGASALGWALVEAATDDPDYGTCLTIDRKKPEIDVRCTPVPDAETKCRQMFEVILGGLMLIAEAHPEHMTIMIGG